MNATITFATRTRPQKAAPQKEPRTARRSIFSLLGNSILKWLLSYPIEIF
ncbi:MAG: hypothetical protein K2Y39_17855 [Candidatus Obscuribacterales bacterium]|nr:hypothetical protein [Candidatus Obscuribacterales bacterium]